MTKLEKLKSNEASSSFVVLLFCVMFVGLAIVFHFIPLVSDDREFLSLNFRNIEEAINYALHYGNGRFLGNLGGIVLAPHSIFAAIYKAFTISLLGILIPLFLQAKNKLTYLLSYFLILTVPARIYAQVYSWNCGNVNYVTPIVLLILGLMLIRGEVKSTFDLILKSVLIIILGISQQLFVEHNAVVNICVAVAMVLYTFYRGIHKKRLLSLFWTISNLIGAYLLFFIPKLIGGQMIKDMSEYRKVSVHSVGEMLETVVENGVSICTYFASFAFLSVIMMAISYYKLKETRTQNKLQRVLAKPLKMFNIVFSVCAVFFAVIGSSIDLFSKSRKLLWMICIIATLEIVVFFLTMIFFSKERSSEIVGLVGAATTVLSVAPLLIVSPVGWRNIFCAFCVIAFVVIFELEKLVQEKNGEWTKALMKVLFVCIPVILLYLGIVSADINDYSNQMKEYIEDEMKNGKREIQVFMIPSDYISKNLMMEFEYYYEKPGDIQFESVEYDVWQYNREQEMKTQVQ